jgi:DNA-binding winged helix-turn-helix (wHTH) protein
VRFLFNGFELDPDRRHLSRGGERVAVSDRSIDILLLLVSRAGQVVAKDDLVRAGWRDVAVSDNSVEQAISGLRRVLATPDRSVVIQTVPRRGYRFCAPIERAASRENDVVLDALLAPHRAFVEGRAALEALDAARVARARQVFEGVLRSAPDLASAHVGMANACAMQFEMTRADPSPDMAALGLAMHHAREACRLDPQSGEVWATLGFVLDRTGQRLDASAAARRSVALEPDNWRHHFRLAFTRWGEERLTASRRTVALLPGFPLAHWLSATVHIARGAFADAERELAAGIAHLRLASDDGTRFSGVALHWLLGLIYHAQGDDARAEEALRLELASEHSGHLYARECAANTRYALAAIRGDVQSPAGSDLILRRATELVLAGDHTAAAGYVEEALVAAAPGNACWLLPVEPVIRAWARPAIWDRALARLANRAA